MKPHLRLFREPDADTVDLMDSPEPTVRVRLGDLLPLERRAPCR